MIAGTSYFLAWLFSEKVTVTFKSSAVENVYISLAALLVLGVGLTIWLTFYSKDVRFMKMRDEVLFFIARSSTEDRYFYISLYEMELKGLPVLKVLQELGKLATLYSYYRHLQKLHTDLIVENREAADTSTIGNCLVKLKGIERLPTWIEMDKKEKSMPVTILAAQGGTAEAGGVPA